MGKDKMSPDTKESPPGAPQEKNAPPDEETPRYGFGRCTPGFLQCCTNPKMALMWLCWFAIVQGFAVNGINNVNTSTLALRYKLPGSRVGLVSSAYDISASILVLPLAYIGARAHQPRMLAIGAIVMALGSFVMITPQIFEKPYEYANRTEQGCDRFGNATYCTDEQLSTYLSNWLYVLMLGQAMHGVGGSMLYSLGVVFIDTHCTTKNNPIYQAVFATSAVFGPALGYIIGGRFLAIYVDYYRVDMSSIDVELGDARWVGAWWLGFVVSSILGFTVFLGLLPYPRELPNAQEIRAGRISMTHADGSETLASRDDFGKSLKDIPTAVKILFCNPTNLLINLAAGTEGVNVSGFATFMPAFLQTQFSLSAGVAAMYGGLISLVGAASGQFFGGMIIRIFPLKIKGMLRLNSAYAFVCLILLASLLSFYCESPNFAGVNVEYLNKTISREEKDPALRHPCNQKCFCTLRSFEPLCSADGVQYFSPCYAGCDSRSFQGGTWRYSNCSCITSLEVLNRTEQASSGWCPLGCTTLAPWLGVFFMVSCLTFMMVVPSTAVALRVIPDRSRTLGMGIRSLFGRLLGTVPGPIIYGAVFDRACKVWQETCTGRGACWVYDRWGMAVLLLITGLSFRTATMVLFLVASFCYKPPAKEMFVEKQLDEKRENDFAKTSGNEQKRPSNIGLPDTGHISNTDMPAGTDHGVLATQL